jgi:hypothetical protein
VTANLIEKGFDPKPQYTGARRWPALDGLPAISPVGCVKRCHRLQRSATQKSRAAFPPHRPPEKRPAPLPP